MKENVSYRLYGTLKCKRELTEEQISLLDIDEEQKNIYYDENTGKYNITILFENVFLTSYDKLNSSTDKNISVEKIKEALNRNNNNEIEEVEDLKLFRVSPYKRPVKEGIVEKENLYLVESKTYEKKLIHEIVKNANKDRLVMRLIKDSYLQEIYNIILKDNNNSTSNISNIYFPKLEEIEKYYHKSFLSALTEEEHKKYETDYYGIISGVKKLLEKILIYKDTYEVRRHLYTHYAKNYSPVIPTEVEKDLINNYYIDKNAQKQYEEYTRGR